MEWVQENRHKWKSSPTGQEQIVYLVDKRDDLLQFEPVKNADIVQRQNSQDGHSELLPQHAACSAGQAAQEPDPLPEGTSAAPQLTVTYVAEQGQQEEQGSPFVSPTNDARHRLRVNRVRGKEQTSQQAP